MRFILATIAFLALSTLSLAQCLPDCKCGCNSGKECKCNAVALGSSDDYTNAKEKALASNTPLVVFVGCNLTPQIGAWSVSVEKLEGYSTGDIVTSAPDNGKLWYVATFKNAKEVQIPKKTTSCNGQSCSESYFPVNYSTPVTQSSCPACPNYVPPSR
jgi:hypothetical protein